MPLVNNFFEYCYVRLLEMTSREEQLGAKSTNDPITTNNDKGVIVVDDIEMQK